MSPTKTSQNKNASQAGNYAIVETSGQQFWLEPNRYYDLDRIQADVNETINLEKILLINDEKGVVLGKPYIEGATVELKVLSHRRGTKIIVYKMRRKKKTRSKNGHRQELTRVMVQSISHGTGTSSAKKSTTSSSGKKASPAKKTSTTTTQKASSTPTTSTPKKASSAKPKQTASSQKKPKSIKSSKIKKTND